MDENDIVTEKRRFERVSCDLRVVLGVTEGEIDEIKAESLDISENGFRLVGDKMFAPNSRYRLVFSLSDELKDIDAVISLMWTKEVSGVQGQYISGFSFSDISPEDRLKVRKFIQDSK